MGLVMERKRRRRMDESVKTSIGVFLTERDRDES